MSKELSKTILFAGDKTFHPGCTRNSKYSVRGPKKGSDPQTKTKHKGKRERDHKKHTRGREKGGLNKKTYCDAT